jgi:AcrR family transcriptional regulator
MTAHPTHETSRADARRAGTRRVILDTTLALIREKGIDKVSWRGIARAVGYSPAGLYEYFDNKDDIVAALAAEGLAFLDRAMRRAASAPSGASRGTPPGTSAETPPGAPTKSLQDTSPRAVEDRLLAMGRAYVRFAHEHPGHFHLVFSVLPSGRRSRAEPAVGAYGMVLEAVQQGIAEGTFVPRGDLDAEAMAYGFWSLVHGLASLQLTALRGFDADLAALDQHVILVFLRGLRR